MFCPNCATTAVPGQRYCRKCGANLGAILDAMDGKRGQIDFETLKADLLQLGMNLRVGFEQAKENFKSQTNRLPTPPTAASWGAAATAPDPVQAQLQAQLAAQQAQAVPPPVVREMRKTIKDLRRMFNKVKAANSRKYSLQQGALKLFTGGASLAAWKVLLAKAAGSGLLLSIERAIQMRADMPVEGLVPVLASLWLLSLIPIAQGVGYLINGIFFAPKPEELQAEADLEAEWAAYEARNYNYAAPVGAPPVAPAPVASVAMPSAVVAPGAISTNEFDRNTGGLKQPISVVEDETRRFEEKQAAKQS